MNEPPPAHDPPADPPNRPAASLPVRLLVMGLLLALSLAAIGSIDGRILHTMGEHDRRTHPDAAASD